MKLLQQGFSLIELMVAVAIVGIIATIAYPSYQGYTCDTYTGQAAADMRLCALALDRHYSDGFTYVGATISGAASSSCSNRSPASGQKKFDISLPVATSNTYTIKAQPASGESCGGTMQLTADGTLTQM